MNGRPCCQPLIGPSPGHRLGILGLAGMPGRQSAHFAGSIPISDKARTPIWDSITVLSDHAKFCLALQGGEQSKTAPALSNVAKLNFLTA